MFGDHAGDGEAMLGNHAGDGEGHVRGPYR